MLSASTPTSSSDDVRGRLLPIYLVCDLSASMSADGRVEALQEAMVALRDAVWTNPVVSDCARVCVIGFAGSAWVALPLCDLALVDDLPTLAPAGLTSYAAAFRLLRDTIARDLAQLAGDDYGVWRPLVFFVSDGEPTDPRPEWLAEHARLVAPGAPWRPEIVSFAVGEAKPATLARVATARCFAADAEAVRDAIAGISDLLIRSVVASGASGAPVVPDTVPDGFEEVDVL